MRSRQLLEKYIDRIIAPLAITHDEKAEMREEWLQHLEESMAALKATGYSEAEAAKLAMERFGSAEHLQADVRRSFWTAGQVYWFKEAIIWALCLLASALGPGLLIGAKYELIFTVAPLCLLIVFCLLHQGVQVAAHAGRGILRRIPGGNTAGERVAMVVRMLGALISYIGVMSIFVLWGPIDSMGSPVGILRELLAMPVLESSLGLFTPKMVHLLWVALLLWRVGARQLPGSRIQVLVQASLAYWLRLLAACLLVVALGQSIPAEAQVLMLNSAILYSFLHIVVDPRRFVSLHSQAMRLLKLR